MSGKLSIKDIAKMSGVSIATVSRIINNKGGYSLETEKKIRDIIDQYGYISNFAAKTLRENKSYSIGLIMPRINNPFFSNLAYHIESFFYKIGYSVLICNTSNSAEKEKEYFKLLTSQNVDGIICISGLNELTDDFITNDIPIVCLDRKPDTIKNIPMVFNDNINASYNATKFLIDKGCKDIVFISSYTAEYRKNDRLAGYMEALKDFNIEFDRSKVLQRNTNNTISETEVLLYEYINSGKKVDGIITTSEESALGALTAIKRCDLSVPNDIKLITFDNTILSQMSNPSLTSVERDPYQLAKNCFDCLLSMINGESYESLISVDTRIIERESTK